MGDAKKAWDRNSGAVATVLDPLDISGYRAGQRADQMEQQMSQDQAQFWNMYNQRPEYQSLMQDGQLQSQYRFDPTLGRASNVDMRNLDRRMGKARNMKLDRMRYTGDIGPGEQYQMSAQDMANLRQRAYAEGPSRYAQRLLDQQGLQQQQARENLYKTTSEQQAAQFSDMARRGGLSGGARERMARQNSLTATLAAQDLARQGRMQQMGIRSQDEAQKMALQQQLPGMGLRMDQYSTGLQQRDRDVRNQLSAQNIQNSRAQQAFNAQIAMQKAGMYGQLANQNAARQQQMRLANMQAQNQAGLYNKQLAAKDLMGRNQFDMGAWQQMMASMGNQQAANAQARASAPRGGFLERLFG